MRQSPRSAAALHRDVLRHMQARDWRAAHAACGSLTSLHPAFAVGWLAASHVALRLKDAAQALAHVDRALELEPKNARFRIQRAQCLLALGRRVEALQAATAAQDGASADAQLLDAIGTLRSYANDHRGALAAYDRALLLAPGDPRLAYNRAAVRRFLGDLQGAEADYDCVVAAKTADHEAYLNRSALRVQTPERNHVAELEALLDHGVSAWPGKVQIHYALAKEYEDLGEYGRSFAHLQRGAGTRREHMRYDVAVDVATVDWIIDAFPEAPVANDPAAAADATVFIVGLPRSGTTLVERILGSHPSLAAAGELDCFALAIVEAARRSSGRTQIPRRDLVALSATLDFAALGRDYLARARAAGGDPGRFTDKMPLNYLYCGLIRRALPAARIIHVTRHPLAVGYAMYKTLFKDGYPFSYDLEEIGRYYLAYRRLMAHWRARMPGVIHEVRYEDLVSDQAGETRKLLEFCGLGWDDACIDFHRNAQASTTASAAQVRRPIYRSSVSQWRHYEAGLAPLRALLESAGIEL